MLKTDIRNTLASPIKRAALLGVGVGLAVTGVTAPLVHADRFDSQIRELQANNNANQSQVAALRVEAGSLQSTIGALHAQITSLQEQIIENNRKSADLEKQIQVAQAELDKQRELLGNNIKTMYLEGDITTIEMLATSNDLSHYFDRQKYRDIVKNKIKTAVDKVTALKTQLNEQQLALERLIAEQATLQSQLVAQKAEQDRLLSLNQAQQSALDSEIRSNYNKIAELRAQQAVENARLFGPGLQNIPDTTGYPWVNAPFPEGGYDPWGMEYRQCVSYTAWRVWRTGRYMPAWGWAGLGNANQWDDNARRTGIPVDGSPRVGDVAIKNAGFYGHAMYVEAVYGDGTILISQYNALWDGKYSVAKISTAGLVFIHFP